MVLKAFIGATDFMSKPFSPNELSIRIKIIYDKKKKIIKKKMVNIFQYKLFDYLNTPHNYKIVM
jgi:DNA-binding response OmpR family regulator